MTPRSPGARVRMPRAERESQMLDVAEQVFGARGVQTATMDEIAERVGVTKPLIYDYFGSKEGLLAATIERARRRLMGELIESWEAATREGRPVRDRVHAVVHAFFAFLEGNDAAFALLRTEGALMGEASASVERIRQQTAKGFAQGLRELPAFAGLPEQRVTAVAEVLIGGCERLAVWRATDDDVHLDADAATEIVVTTIWDGLSGAVTPRRTEGADEPAAGARP